MAEPFLEERLPIGIKMGATYADEYSVEITKTASGKEYRRLVQPYPQRYYTIGYIGMATDLWARLLSLYHRCYGMYAGFRVLAMDDFSTNGNTLSPTALDQTLALSAVGVYQLQKEYGAGGTPLSIGLPKRTIFKPVAGTTKLSIGAKEVAASGFAVDNVTGLVTIANKTKAITGITKAAQAVLTVGSHTFAVGEPVHISGVVGMIQINNQRALITAKTSTTITVAINSTAYSTYSSGGVANLRPQTGEAVKGGCQFDIPFRFNSRIDVSHVSADVRDTSDIEIVELISL